MDTSLTTDSASRRLAVTIEQIRNSQARVIATGYVVPGDVILMGGDIPVEIAGYLYYLSTQVPNDNGAWRTTLSDGVYSVNWTVEGNCRSS